MKPPYQTIDQLPREISVFPLAGTILLPRASLPLNVFEPRYLALIDAALARHRIIGIIQPLGDGGATGSPQSNSAALAGVGCAGRITMFQEQEDGRLLIALTGIARFTLTREVGRDAPYRTFEANWMQHAGDLGEHRGEDEVDRDRLLETLKRFLDQRKLAADWRQIAGTPSEQLVNWLSLAAPFGPSEKQGLLEAPTLKARAEMLVALAEMELASGGSGQGTRLQ